MSRERRSKDRRVPLLIAMLAVVAVLAVRGPVWYRRVYHPLKYEGAIAQASARYDVDPYLIAAVINTESGFDRRGVSKKGAIGLMQLMPETAKEARRTSRLKPPAHEEALKDPEVNIDLGTHYLGKLMQRYDRPEWALAAYNAGATNADKWQREATSGPPADSIGYPVTRRYVTKVLRERDEYRTLYPEAFEGASGE